MRFITFTIPGQPDVRIRLVEQPDGTILATVLLDPGKKADLRGLFFDVRDSSILPHLSAFGPHVTGTMFKNNAVSDLGQGANIKGGGRAPFDAGIEFGTSGKGKDVVQDTSFVLKSAVGGLTLDDLALVRFGTRMQGAQDSNKTVFLAPAAPDAIDDSLSAVEDVTKVFHLLANDTDEDGTADFRIVWVSDPAHGTATISADGKSVIYLADPDYSGPDSFTYGMIDGHGGGDSASVSIGVIAVADAPTLLVTTAPGADVNDILVTVTSAVTDVDGSEYVDRFVFSGLPDGVVIVEESDLVYDPATTGQSMTQTFTLRLPPDTDQNFTFTVTSLSKELSNLDEEPTARSLQVLIDSNSTDFARTFEADDQSMWASGDAAGVSDDRFLGLDIDPPEAGGDFHGDFALKAGFQSTFSIHGGQIDADVPYDITIATTYNHVTDVLLIQSNAVLDAANVSFLTDSPGGRYALSFIFNWFISAGLSVEGFDIFDFSAGDNRELLLLDVDADDLEFQHDFDYGLSILLAWPNVDSQSDPSTTATFSSSGESENFFTLNLDLDDALADIFLQGENPFELTAGIDITLAEISATLELLDVDLYAALSLVQDFLMTVDSLTGWLIFEDGSRQAWDFSDVVIQNASALDADGDGIIEFDLELAPNVRMRNETDLGVNVGYDVAFLRAIGEYDIGLGELSYSDSFQLGPVSEFSQSRQLTTIDLYDETFDLDFRPQTLTFAGNENEIVIA